MHLELSLVPFQTPSDLHEFLQNTEQQFQCQLVFFAAMFVFACLQKSGFAQVPHDMKSGNVNKVSNYGVSCMNRFVRKFFRYIPLAIKSIKTENIEVCTLQQLICKVMAKVTKS